MKDNKNGIFIAKTELHTNDNKVKGNFTTLNGDKFYKITNYDSMPPFFMNIVSSSDHWMFISSTGGLSAGRIDSNNALFPYYTVDKLTENHESVGQKTLILVDKSDRKLLWEPFSKISVYHIERNLYKSICGEQIVFEEINHDLKMCFRYSWKTSENYGFVLEAKLNSQDYKKKVKLLSGLLDIQPWGVTEDMQHRLSNLLEAYKLNELEPKTGIGIFGLSAKISDLAEPSESLKATTVWQYGIDDPCYLLSARQLNNFRYSGKIQQEERVQGERGAFFVGSSFKMNPGEEKNWTLIAEINQDHSSLIRLKNNLFRDRNGLFANVVKDYTSGTENLKRIISRADGLQCSNDKLSTVHHFANVLYNTMRGGIFHDNYQIHRSYFLDYLSVNNKEVIKRYSGFIEELPETLPLPQLLKLAGKFVSTDLNRLCHQYLPIYFSRRHGDPSRPWNKFSIKLKENDGSCKLDYQGNWRDIFQNWEALALSYPEYIESMIFRFLNATTADGYNPYRIHLNGIDWEKPDPNDPWSNIGYWSDHQIIYLQKLLELSLKFHPGRLQKLLSENSFVHSNIPYKIRPYASILKDPYETIEYDEEKNLQIEKRVKAVGTDGQLIFNENGEIVYSNMIEKLVILLLAKISNLIPGGGLWMNTQRPEWNDANNALAGRGLSVVSICYLRRQLFFLNELLNKDIAKEFSLSIETVLWLHELNSVLSSHRMLLSSINEEQLKSFMDGCGQAADKYRQKLYCSGFSMKKTEIKSSELTDFFSLTLEYLDDCIKRNKRSDGLYHSYNILSYDDTRANISNLYEMLEGQVAVLSSGLLKPAQSLKVLKALRQSKMYRADQHSYILYPDRRVPGFLEKNTFNEDTAKNISLIAALQNEGNTKVVERDENGNYHFNGNFHNVKDLQEALSEIRKDDKFKTLVEKDSIALEKLFIQTFNHQEFTGRSGTFFGYEGLGSIYWHMVSKLLLASQEAVITSFNRNENRQLTSKLIEAYYDIREGIGFNKNPEVYGAFPADPYSHTPACKGAKQPGMTGQVKEEIITRLAEVGIVVEKGKINFIPFLLRKKELLEKMDHFVYYDLIGKKKSIELAKNSMAFTFCQVPFIIVFGNRDQITLKRKNGSMENLSGNSLPAKLSQSIFMRSGEITRVIVESSKIGLI